jgi:hypothetical protein
LNKIGQRAESKERRVKRKVKTLTAEIAEHAEIKTDEGPKPGVQGKKGALFQRFPEG